MIRRSGTVRALYLELAALGADLRTGQFGQRSFAKTHGSFASVNASGAPAYLQGLLSRRRSRACRPALRENLVEMDDPDLRAIRQEERAS